MPNVLTTDTLTVFSEAFLQEAEPLRDLQQVASVILEHGDAMREERSGDWTSGSSVPPCELSRLLAHSSFELVAMMESLTD